MKEIEKMSNANEQRWAAVQTQTILKETGLSIQSETVLADGRYAFPETPEADLLVVKSGHILVFGWNRGQGQWGLVTEFDSLAGACGK
jgi:hypothetical protein